MKIKILPQAQNDILVGYSFYEKQRKNLGNYFVNNIYSEIDSLVIYNKIHKKIKSYYQLLVLKFPYAIYYKVIDNRIIIYAILDCRINPPQISDRLEK